MRSLSWKGFGGRVAPSHEQEEQQSGGEVETREGARAAETSGHGAVGALGPSRDGLIAGSPKGRWPLCHMAGSGDLAGTAAESCPHGCRDTSCGQDLKRTGGTGGVSPPPAELSGHFLCLGFGFVSGLPSLGLPSRVAAPGWGPGMLQAKPAKGEVPPPFPKRKQPIATLASSGQALSQLDLMKAGPKGSYRRPGHAGYTGQSWAIVGLSRRELYHLQSAQPRPWRLTALRWSMQGGCQRRAHGSAFLDGSQRHPAARLPPPEPRFHHLWPGHRREPGDSTLPALLQPPTRRFARASDGRLSEAQPCLPGQPQRGGTAGPRDT